MQFHHFAHSSCDFIVGNTTLSSGTEECADKITCIAYIYKRYKPAQLPVGNLRILIDRLLSVVCQEKLTFRISNSSRLGEVS